MLFDSELVELSLNSKAEIEGFGDYDYLCSELEATSSRSAAFKHYYDYRFSIDLPFMSNYICGHDEVIERLLVTYEAKSFPSEREATGCSLVQLDFHLSAITSDTGLNATSQIDREYRLCLANSDHVLQAFAVFKSTRFVNSKDMDTAWLEKSLEHHFQIQTPTLSCVTYMSGHLDPGIVRHDKLMFAKKNVQWQATPEWPPGPTDDRLGIERRYSRSFDIAIIQEQWANISSIVSNWILRTSKTRIAGIWHCLCNKLLFHLMCNKMLSSFDGPSYQNRDIIPSWCAVSPTKSNVIHSAKRTLDDLFNWQMPQGDISFENSGDCRNVSAVIEKLQAIPACERVVMSSQMSETVSEPFLHFEFETPNRKVEESGSVRIYSRCSAYNKQRISSVVTCETGLAGSQCPPRKSFPEYNNSNSSDFSLEIDEGDRTGGEALDPLDDFMQMQSPDDSSIHDQPFQKSPQTTCASIRHSPKHSASLKHEGHVQSKFKNSPKTVKNRPKCIVAPESLVLSKWTLDVASQCLKAKRALVLLPPPLSVLTSIVILANTYLEDPDQDHRIIIYCDGSIKHTDHIFGYIDSILAGKHKLFRVHPGTKACNDFDNARVIVTESLRDLGSNTIRFSLAVFCIQCDMMSNYHSNIVCQLKALEQRHRDYILKEPSTLVFAPFPSCFNFQWAIELESLQSLVDCIHVIVKDPVMDPMIQASLDLMRPSHIFLTLPQDEEDAFRVIEEVAFPVILSLWKTHGDRPKDDIPPNLAALDLSLFQNDLQRPKNDVPCSEPTFDLLCLNVLKRALSFCANYGVYVSISFLKEAARRHSSPVIHDCLRRVQNVAETAGCTKTGGPNDTLIDKKLRFRFIENLIGRERQKMVQEDRSIRASRVQKKFRCLLLTETGQAAGALLSNLAAKDISELQLDDEPDQFVFVAHIEQVKCFPKQQSSAVLFFGQFSHVCYVADNMCDSWSTCLPFPVEQLGSANALRVIFVVTDTSRSREGARDFSERNFLQVCQGLQSRGGAKPLYDIADLRRTLHSICSTECLDKQERRLTSCKAGDQFVVSAGIISRYSTDKLAEHLFAKLRVVMSRRQTREKVPKLLVIMVVHQSSKCGPASTTLHQTIASHDYLANNVIVETKFIRDTSSIL
jgi:hypothetical protein